VYEWSTDACAIILVVLYSLYLGALFKKH
jgi:hypothetical protein